MPTDTSANDTAPADLIEALRNRPGGLTVRDIARRYRVGEDKVRGWIRRGELRAINTSATMCGKPRWVVTAEALAEFERRRTAAPAPKPPRRRRRPVPIDYYP